MRWGAATSWTAAPRPTSSSGGAGRDFINSANGRDKVSGGKGNDAINVSTAGPAAKVKCGKGKDIVRYNHNERRRIKGCERRYSIK